MAMDALDAHMATLNGSRDRLATLVDLRQACQNLRLGGPVASEIKKEIERRIAELS